MKTFAFLICTLLATFPLLAQNDMEVVASDLRAPVGIEMDSNGNLWIAESGTGEDDGAISVIWADGTVERVIDNLPSFFDTETNEVAGPMRAHVINEQYLGVSAGEAPGALESTILIYALDSFQQGMDPLSADEVLHIIRFKDQTRRLGFTESNPYTLVHDGCNMFVVDAAANAVLRRDGLTGVMTVFAEFPPQANPLPFGPPFIDAVPTRILENPDGGFIVSQLTGFPFVDDASKIYDVDASGQVTVRDSLFTLVTDLRHHPSGDGLLALQYARFHPDSLPPFLVNSSMITHLHDDGTRDTIATGFGPSPGMAVTSDTILYVTQLFAGTVLRISPMTTGLHRPGDVAVEQLRIFPNPANEEVTLSFDLQNASGIHLRIFDPAGRLIYSKDLGRLPAGEQQVLLDSRQFHQAGTKSYFISLVGEKEQQWGRLIMDK